MSDFIAQDHLTKFPPESSADMPIASGSLRDISMEQESLAHINPPPVYVQPDSDDPADWDDYESDFTDDPPFDEEDED